MSTLLRSKRAIERTTGPTTFRRYPNTDGDGPIELHTVAPMMIEHDWGDTETTCLGTGETHADAVEDARETLSVRRELERRNGLGDYLRDEARQ
jgi:hypothetical protein